MKRTHRKSGFTLIEMVVVIGIIALLAALTMGISNSVIRNSQVRQTQDAMRLLALAVDEWELERGRPITFEGFIPINGGRYDIYTNGEVITQPSDSSSVNNDDMQEAMETRIVSLVELLLQSEPASDILAKISPDFFIEDINGKLLVDPWGNPMGVIFPGRKFSEAYPDLDPLAEYPYLDESNDMTVRDEAEDGLGSCVNGRLLFVSSGPDLRWGYRYQGNDGVGNPTLIESSKDNIYSYDPFVVEEAR